MIVRIVTDTMGPEIQRLASKIKDPSEAMAEIGSLVSSMASSAFQNADLRPHPWASLKPETIKRKARKHYGSHPLVASGTLARSPRVVSSSPRNVVVGSDRRAGAYSLAAIHQLGAPKANIPPRPFFPFQASGEATETAKRRVREVILRWLKK